MENNFRSFKCKEKEIFVDPVLPTIEQAPMVVLKVIEQAIKDCVVMYGERRFDGNPTWLTAYDFIFDDEFLVEWGEILISPEEMMSLVGLNIEYMREMVRKKMLEKVG
jgi:hypothetical protein